MVPSAFVILDELPLSANGKVDRTLLPKPEASVEMVSQEYVAPSTDNEQMVAAIWRDVLGVEKVGLYDNFFDIGGNSLKLIRVHIKLREALNTDLSIAQMFEHPTVSSLASVLSSTDAAGTALDDVDDRASRQHEAFSRARRLTGIRREDGDRDMAEDHN
jgi:aryl carrier-like protein